MGLEALQFGREDVMYVSVGAVTGLKIMCSISVSYNKVLLLLVVDLHWKYGV